MRPYQRQSITSWSSVSLRHDGMCVWGGACMYNMYMHARQVMFCMHAWLYTMYAWTIHLVLACIHEIMCPPATMISDIFKQVYTQRRFKIKIHILKLPFIDHYTEEQPLVEARTSHCFKFRELFWLLLCKQCHMPIALCIQAPNCCVKANSIWNCIRTVPSWVPDTEVVTKGHWCYQWEGKDPGSYSHWRTCTVQGTTTNVILY